MIAGGRNIGSRADRPVADQEARQEEEEQPGRRLAAGQSNRRVAESAYERVAESADEQVAGQFDERVAGQSDERPEEGGALYDRLNLSATVAGQSRRLPECIIIGKFCGLL